MADIILPNITEACFMTDIEYKTEYDKDYIMSLLKALAVNNQTVVLTGVSYKPETTGVVVYENGNTEYYKHRKIAQGCHGTGDVYASAFCGALMRGKTKIDAAKIAAGYSRRMRYLIFDKLSYSDKSSALYVREPNWNFLSLPISRLNCLAVFCGSVSIFSFAMVSLPLV